MKFFKRLKNKKLADVFLYGVKSIFTIYSSFKPFEQYFAPVSPLKLKSYSREPNFDSDNFFEGEDPTLLIATADELIRHEISLLGSGKVYLSEHYENCSFDSANTDGSINKVLTFVDTFVYKPINWHCDFKSGYVWSNNLNFTKTRNAVKGMEGVDIKFPWELSRFQHLTVLMKAYQSTKDKQYLKEIIYQITDWILNNPPYRGVNWTCTMDVAIRLANWSLVIDFIETRYKLPQEYKSLINASFNDHISFIVFNFEWTAKLTSNHFLANVSGLYMGLLYLNKYAFLKTWCIRRLEKEICYQTLPDGMNSESSTSYHRLVLELFAFPFYFSSPGLFSENYLDRLYNMFSFVYWLKRRNGSIPIIGDNDSGIFIQISLNQVTNLSYLDSLAMRIFKENIDGRVSLGSKLFKESGIFVYKSDKIYLCVSNMLNGQNGNGGHSHNDNLSFELVINNYRVIVDPGNYVYTPFPELRNLYRSTFSHNTVSICGEEQNRFIEDELFSMVNDITSVTNTFSEIPTKSEIVYKGTHNGFVRNGNDFVHERTFRISERKIEIFDLLISSQQLLSGCASFMIPRHCISSVNENSIETKYFVLFFSESKVVVDEPLSFAPEYGILSYPLIPIRVYFDEKLKSSIIFK